MKHIFATIGLFALMITLPAFAADKPVVKIGVTVPLTGDVAYIGEGIRNAITMAQENLPADTKYKYEVVYEDDMFEAKRTAATTNKMINVNKVDALISASSGTGGVASPIAEANKVIHFGIASAASVADGNYNFNHWTSPDEEGRLMAAELKKRGYKNVAAFYLNQQGVLAIMDGLKKNLEGSDIKFVSDEVINPGEKDFRTVISKAKAKNPDIYVAIFFTPQMEIIMKQLKEANVNAPITSVEGFALSNEPALFEGLWYVDSAAPKTDFADKFTAKYGKAPTTYGAANAYDIFNLIVYGYEHTTAEKKPKTEEVTKTLYTVKDYDGVLGKLSIDDKGVVFSSASVRVFKDGKPVPVTE